MLIQRKKEMDGLKKLQTVFPVVAILGARQCGKTSLAKQFSYDHYFDLENPRDLSRLENPQLALENLKGLIVIDEIQRAPELFSLIRFLVDTQRGQQYLILGSASKTLIQQTSESLAGRIGYHYLGGFSIEEARPENLRRLWMRGGYPLSFLANSDSESQLWRENYLTTFLERDLPQLGIQIPAQTIRRFWVMLSHYHGQILNYSELGRSFGISDMTIRKYVDILEGTFMVRVLWPWSANLKKRVVKRPKIYIRDSGLFHTLMSLDTEEQLTSHPKLGASWEGFAIESVLKRIATSGRSVYFWRTHEGAEVDILWQESGKNWGIEFKYTDAPRRTKSMQSAVTDLQLEHLWIVYPGSQAYPIDDKISVLPMSAMTEDFSFMPPDPNSMK